MPVALANRKPFLACLVLMLVGCTGLRLKPVTSSTRSTAARKSDQGRSAKNRDAAEATAANDNIDILPPPLRKDGWSAALAPEPPTDRSQGRRWRHRDLETLHALPLNERPDFAAELASGDKTVATNAAICLTRLGDSRGRTQLIGAVGNKDLRLPFRCAAAEALAETAKPSPLEALRELTTRYGEFSTPSYLAELHAELLYGLAEHVDAGADERFVSAVKSPVAAARLAAIRGWLRPGTAALPEAAADLRTDPDHRVRAATLGAMAARHHPFALDAARGGLTDYRLEVRLAAVAALGQIGGKEAQQALEGLERESEVIRAAAVGALAKLGARDRVWAAAESPSWHVRQSVAAALVHWPDAGGALLARRLLADASIEVEKEVLATLAKWPLEVAGPVLLEAMGGNAYMARKSAAAQLAERWPPAREFTADAPGERRTAALSQLRQQWSGQFGIASLESMVPRGTEHSAVEVPLVPERIERARQIVQRLQQASPTGAAASEALGELAGFGPDLPRVLGQIVDEGRVVLPDAVYRQVLPKFGGQYEVIDRLLSTDVQQRRRAAGSLAAAAEQGPLNSVIVARLAELGTAEPDSLVWTGMLRAVAKDGREPAVRLAYAGLGHRAAEVRREAIEYLAAHSSPAHAPLILPALKDKNQAVVSAAVKALGHPGMLVDAGPLERLLVTNDRALRLALAESLIALGAPSGPQTLELLAHDTDIGTRRKAAQLMGSVGDRRYTETLIGLLDDTLGVRTAALASLPKVVGRDVAERPDDPPTSTLDRVERWKRWWQSSSS
ncbi:MAG TPA: HEAT repeat domain-containing protein [Pirellulales bacterium]|nr:HEAT repeat domain-containing protein [Pirellulales bacterium]